MPDPSGNLLPDEFQTALSWLREHWQDLSRPMHPQRPTNWEIGGMIMTLPFTGQGVVLGGPTFPLVVVTCGQCGFTALVNGIKAGLVPTRLTCLPSGVGLPRNICTSAGTSNSATHDPRRTTSRALSSAIARVVYTDSRGQSPMTEAGALLGGRLPRASWDWRSQSVGTSVMQIRNRRMSATG
jgi:hypothetical protein